MTKKLWIDEANSPSTLKTRMHIDDSENKYHFEDVQDVQPLLDMNKKESNLGNNNLKFKGELGKHAGMTKVASIPLIVVQQLAQKGIMTNAGAIKDKIRFRKWLNDPDNGVFKLYNGKI
jgi:hypothetical protein|tara:strand:- start:6251 stop:6607 length:357 start_codon:yes stop_codon:yes gene_type:complete